MALSLPRSSALDAVAGAVADAVSVFGFAFYLQPLIMPLFNEMPGLPRHKARISTWAMRFAVLGQYCTPHSCTAPFEETQWVLVLHSAAPMAPRSLLPF